MTSYLGHRRLYLSKLRFRQVFEIDPFNLRSKGRMELFYREPLRRRLFLDYAGHLPGIFCLDVRMCANSGSVQLQIVDCSSHERRTRIEGRSMTFLKMFFCLISRLLMRACKPAKCRMTATRGAGRTLPQWAALSKPW